MYRNACKHMKNVIEYIEKEYLVTYAQWQSLPHTPVDPGEDVQEQNMPSSNFFLAFLVRYIS